MSKRYKIKRIANALSNNIYDGDIIELEEINQSTATPSSEAISSTVTKDWEVVEGGFDKFSRHKWVINNIGNNCEESGCKIYSVKRLSDGTVFSVGDEVSATYNKKESGVIESFVIKDGYMSVLTKDYIIAFHQIKPTTNTFECLSINDVLSCCHDDSVGDEYLYLSEKKLIELVKSKTK